MVTRSPSNGGEARDSASDERSLFEEVAIPLRDALSNLERGKESLMALLRIQVHRARHTLLNALLAVLLGAGLLAAGMTALVLATARCVRGLADGIAAASGVPWIGDLVGGGATLALLAGATALGVRSLRRRELAAIRESLDPAVPEGEAEGSEGDG